MTTQAIAHLSAEDVAAHRNGSGAETPLQPLILRLDDVPATGENRVRLLERIRRLNRSLEESGTPFRLRLL
jgi:hypothetical protein